MVLADALPRDRAQRELLPLAHLHDEDAVLLAGVRDLPVRHVACTSAGLCSSCVTDGMTAQWSGKGGRASPRETNSQLQGSHAERDDSAGRQQARSGAVW